MAAWFDSRVLTKRCFSRLGFRVAGRIVALLSMTRFAFCQSDDSMAAIRFIAPPMRYEGRSTSIGFAYPRSVVVRDHLCVIYPVNKEDLEIARIPLYELRALK
jgi:hypothetical protein